MSFLLGTKFYLVRFLFTVDGVELSHVSGRLFARFLLQLVIFLDLGSLQLQIATLRLRLAFRHLFVFLLLLHGKAQFPFQILKLNMYVSASAMSKFTSRFSTLPLGKFIHLCLDCKKVEQLVSFLLTNRTPSNLNSNTYCKNLMAKQPPPILQKCAHAPESAQYPFVKGRKS